MVSWLRENSKRPMAAMAIWAELFTALRFDTGEIALTRAELAERVGDSSSSRVEHHDGARGDRSGVAGPRGAPACGTS